MLVPRKKVSARSWWNTRRNTWGWIQGGTKEHTSEGNMTTVQTCRIKFESLSICQYKLSNIWINRKVISRLTKSTNKNQISLTTQIPFSKVLWECVRMKETLKTRDAGGEEQWGIILTSFRDTATRSNGFKVIRTTVCPIGARVVSIGDLLGLFTGTAPSGRGLIGNNTEIGSIWDPSILMGYRYMRILLWHLFAMGWSVVLYMSWMEVLSMKTLQRCGLRIDPVYLMHATQPGVSHTSRIHV